MTDSTAKLVERLAYDAYGGARHQPKADLNGDGATTTGSGGEVNAIRTLGLANSGAGTPITASTYNPDADLNRDGAVTSSDYTLAQAAPGSGTGGVTTAAAPGMLNYSPSGSGTLPGGGVTDNIVGYCGYLFNAEVPGGGMYTVRFRNYDASIGRWLERDMAGYIDGMSLYGYCGGGPVGASDPMGLIHDTELERYEPWPAAPPPPPAPMFATPTYLDSQMMFPMEWGWGMFDAGWRGEGQAILNTVQAVLNIPSSFGNMAIDGIPGAQLLPASGIEIPQVPSFTFANGVFVEGAAANGVSEWLIQFGIVTLILPGAGAAEAGEEGAVLARQALRGAEEVAVAEAKVAEAAKVVTRPRLPPRGTPERAAIEAARKAGIEAKQVQELADIMAGGKGSGIWTEAELVEIRRTGKFPKDAYWHHDPTVANRPDLAGDPAVIHPGRGGRAAHLRDGHNGNWRYPCGDSPEPPPPQKD